MLHIPALTEPGLGSRIHAGTKWIDIIKSVVFQSTYIFPEQSKYQRLLRLQHFQAAQREPANTQNNNTDNWLFGGYETDDMYLTEKAGIKVTAATLKINGEVLAENISK